MLQLIQMFSFTFQEHFERYWKNEYFFNNISPVLNYFRLVPLLQGRILQYSIVFFLIIILILFYVTISLYISYNLVHSGKNWISNLNYFLSQTFFWFIKILFVPLLNCLMTIYNCKDSNVTYIENYKCSGLLYYIYCSISGFTIIIFLIFSYMGLIICYDTLFQPNNYFCKLTSLPEVMLFFLQFSLIVISEVIKNEDFFIFIFVILFFFFWFSINLIYFITRK